MGKLKADRVFWGLEMTATGVGGIPEELLAAIQTLADKDKNVAAVILFGSRAKGGWRAGSDVDIAIQTVGFGNGERLAAYIFLETKSDWEALGAPFGLDIDLDHYEPFSGGIVAPAVEEHGIELFRRTAIGA